MTAGATWRQFADPEKLARALADAVADDLREGIAVRGRAALVLSGGVTGAAAVGTTTAPNTCSIGPDRGVASPGVCTLAGSGRVAAKIFRPQNAVDAATRAQTRKPVQRELMRRL